MEFEGRGAVCRFSDDGTHFATVNSREFRIWAAADKMIRVVPMSETHTNIVYWLRFSQKGKTLVSGHVPGFLVWSVVDHQLQHIFYPKTEGYFLGRSSVLSPCEELLATSILGIRNSNDIAITIWYITSGTLIAEMTGHEDLSSRWLTHRTGIVWSVDLGPVSSMYGTRINGKSATNS